MTVRLTDSTRCTLRLDPDPLRPASRTQQDRRAGSVAQEGHGAQLESHRQDSDGQH